MLRLPGLLDPHVHVREPGATHKEDWGTATAAALAGGFTAILAMPNTQPPITDAAAFQQACQAAQTKAHCDYAQHLGATAHNADEIVPLAARAAGLKMYLNQTYGSLRLDDTTAWHAHFKNWPRERALVVHAEGHTVAAAILFAALYDRPVHIAHVSRREEILLIREAKAHGLPVTCEVTPHHLFLTADDVAHLPPGRREVRPRLATPADRQALWDNLDVIDCFATDHAPHTLDEKDSPNPPPGFPGLETALPLLLTAVHEGRLSMEALIARLHTNPHRIFGIAPQPDTWVEIDPHATWEIPEHGWHSRANWTPFAGMKVHGRVRRVILRGQAAFEDGRILAPAGFGRSLRG